MYWTPQNIIKKISFTYYKLFVIIRINVIQIAYHFIILEEECLSDEECATEGEEHTCTKVKYYTPPSTSLHRLPYPDTDSWSLAYSTYSAGLTYLTQGMTCGEYKKGKKLLEITRKGKKNEPCI